MLASILAKCSEHAVAHKQKRRKPLIVQKVKQKMQKKLAKYCRLFRTREKSILDTIVSNV